MVSRGQDEENPAGEAPSEAPRGDDVEDLGSVGERIDSIISAAERAAADIREDAEKRAQRYYEESKRRADEMADLTDSLVQRARQVAQQSDHLITALEDLEAASRRLTGLGTAQEPGLVEVAPAPPPAQQLSPAPEASAPGAAGGAGAQPDGARVLAKQMATADRSRAEIARCLRDEFGVLDPTAILNEVWA